MRYVAPALDSLRRAIRLTAIVLTGVAIAALTSHALSEGFDQRTVGMLLATLISGIGLLLLSTETILKWQKQIGATLITVGVVTFALS